jgi:hypothetical protein
LNLVNVAINAPVMKECVKDLVTAKNAQTRTDNTGIKVMRKWIL